MKNGKPAVVNTPVSEERATKESQIEVFKQEREAAKLTRAEIANRVRQLRKELEAAKERYDGALMDNLTDGIPRSLDIVNVNREPSDAVFYLSPTIEVLFEHMQEGFFPSDESDDVGELTIWSTQIALAIGMLMGAIYADSPPATVDRFERALAYSIWARHWEVVDSRHAHKP